MNQSPNPQSFFPKADPQYIDRLFDAAEVSGQPVVDEGMTLEGSLVCERSDRPIVILGTVRGNIRSAGPVIVLEAGSVQGSIRAPRVVIAGRVCRNEPGDGVVAEGELALASSARLECNAVYEHLHAERGAHLAGNIVPAGSSYFHELLADGKLPFYETLDSVEPRPLSKEPARAAAAPVAEPTPVASAPSLGSSPAALAPLDAVPIAHVPAPAVFSFNSSREADSGDEGRHLRAVSLAGGASQPATGTRGMG